MARERRRRRTRGGASAKSNSERWLITYADLITLLMIFFVVMYAMSKVDETKFETLSLSLSKALSVEGRMEQNGGLLPQHAKSEPRTEEEKREAEQQRFDDLIKKVEAFVREEKLAGQVNVIETERGVQITLNDAALFASGSAEVKAEAVRLLQGLSPFLMLVDNQVAVEGHTDDVPITNARFRSNWELSSQRAINVLHVFEAAGVAHGRLYAEGYADTRPLAPNDGDVNRASNRRVNLVVLREYRANSIAPF